MSRTVWEQAVETGRLVQKLLYKGEVRLLQLGWNTATEARAALASKLRVCWCIGDLV